ncbi:MAG: sel1 repeat family protein [Neisseria sp.]|nr:sel1 repeat family protein [Neisseria sp.]
MKNWWAVLAMLLCVPYVAAEPFEQQAYEQAAEQCRQNDLERCVQWAIWTRDVMESPAAAFAPLKKACDGGHLRGCNVLGNLYLHPYSGLGMDYDKAILLYKQACDGGYQAACGNLKQAENEAVHKQNEAEQQQRLAGLQRSCMRGNSTACEALYRELNSTRKKVHLGTER